MKTLLHISLVLTLALLCSHTARAQIKNDESSISILAIQCAMSSGFPAAGFADYSTGLAKSSDIFPNRGWFRWRKRPSRQNPLHQNPPP